MSGRSGMRLGGSQSASVDIGRAVPAWTSRVLLGLVASALLATQFSFGFWMLLATIVAGFGVALPRTLMAWVFAFLAAATLLWRTPDIADWHAYVALAGIHLVHVFAALSVYIPARGLVQTRALARPLIRFVLNQIPAQLVLAASLLLASHRLNTAPWLAIVAASALIGIAVFAALPLARRRATAGQTRDGTNPQSRGMRTMRAESRR